MASGAIFNLKCSIVGANFAESSDPRKPIEEEVGRFVATEPAFRMRHPIKEKKTKKRDNTNLNKNNHIHEQQHDNNSNKIKKNSKLSQKICFMMIKNRKKG